ncbi:MAG: DNA replication/repair protein RecF [Calditrichia bacterium]
MILESIKIKNFRNYSELEIGFQEGTHILYGNNGQGKTNFLEAIYYLALTKSFRSSRDQNLVKHQADFFRLEGNFATRSGRKYRCAVAYSADQGKRLQVNGETLSRFSEHIGQIPLVLLAPSDIAISQESPGLRRQFLDILLCQASRFYMHSLVQYKRALKQRNALLAGSAPEELLLPWDETLAKEGAIIIQKRAEAIQELDEAVKSYYKMLSNNQGNIKLIYQPSLEIKADDLHGAFIKALESNRKRDFQYGTTSVGPHRDEILFLINGKPLRVVGSQGEHKTLVISLKIAEFNYLQKVRNEPPILLFDDLFGELDARRIKSMLNTLSDIGQVFVTTTAPDFFGKMTEWRGDTRFYEISAGTLVKQEEAWQLPGPSIN